MSNWTDAIDTLDAAMAEFYDYTTGTARKTVVFQRYVNSRTLNGELTKSWQTFASMSDVLVTSMGGSEQEQEDKLNAFRGVEFDMDYLEGLKPNMRAVFDSEIYNIVSVDVDETNSYRTWVKAEQITGVENGGD